MKQIISVFLILSLIACSGAKKTVTYEGSKIPKGLKEFLIRFEKASVEHNKKLVLELMDPNYIEEQHNEMLGGRTDQFLNELFCGNQTNGKGFKCPGFENITKLKLIGVKNNTESYTVYYIITTGEFEIKRDWEVTKQVSKFGIIYGIYGACG